MIMYSTRRVSARRRGGNEEGAALTAAIGEQSFTPGPGESGEKRSSRGLANSRLEVTEQHLENSSRPVQRVAPCELVFASIRRRLVIADALLIALTIVTVLVLGFGQGEDLPYDSSRIALSLALAVTWPLMLWITSSRDSTVVGAGVEEYRRVLAASGWTLLLVATFAYFTTTTYARTFLLASLGIGTVLLLSGRWANRVITERELQSGMVMHRAFVVAETPQQQQLHEMLDATGNRFQYVGQWVAQPSDSPEDIVSAAEAAYADTLLLVPPGAAGPEWTRRLGWALEDTDIDLLVSPALMDVTGPRLSVRHIQGMPFVSLEQPRFGTPARILKRTVDIIGATLGLIVLALPMGLIALAIKRDSPGPVLFSQDRMGQDNQVFKCHKFRTMRVGADAELATLRAEAGSDGATFKLTEDPRVTRVGAFLRRTSLDELPQLWNVLVNEMSLVGPRPHQLADVELYDADDHRRLRAKPGITGLWQVSGRSDTTWEENVVLDLHYVDNWSFALDVMILMRTVKVVLTGSGAY